MIHRLFLFRNAFVALTVVTVYSTGCSRPNGEPSDGRQSQPPTPSRTSTAAAEDVAAVQALIDGLGGTAAYTLLPGGVTGAGRGHDGDRPS
jgi:hypothetical protein